MTIVYQTTTAMFRWAIMAYQVTPPKKKQKQDEVDQEADQKVYSSMK